MSYFNKLKGYKMKITKEKLIEILKENLYISEIIDDFLDITFDEPREIDTDVYSITMFIELPDLYESNIVFEVDTKNYDEKFADIDEYEIEDMGIVINMFDNCGDGIELNLENIWKYLFFNKEKT